MVFFLGRREGGRGNSSGGRVCKDQVRDTKLSDGTLNVDEE
jgi:hypothetical protein